MHAECHINPLSYTDPLSEVNVTASLHMYSVPPRSSVLVCFEFLKRMHVVRNQTPLGQEYGMLLSKNDWASTTHPIQSCQASLLPRLSSRTGCLPTRLLAGGQPHMLRLWPFPYDVLAEEQRAKCGLVNASLEVCALFVTDVNSRTRQPGGFRQNDLI